eukprot:TRINITY_DN13114_c0_g1_i1.p1 TRINITY_DN13114_c0_g1~~TRINITY_DN13114_c0_g1_i1.p1  ORF type:complete len:255 (+),score=46.53 TRINITY_DN13114_c0_g1_i1:111-875(+)
MKFRIKFPNTNFRDLEFDAKADSVVEDAIMSAAAEWDVEAEFLDLMYSSKVLPSQSRLVTFEKNGKVRPLVAAKKPPNIVTKKQLRDPFKREKISQMFEHNPSLTCIIDASTMVVDRCLKTGEYLLPYTVKKVAFTNCEDISEIGNDFLRGCDGMLTVDMTQLKSVTTIGGGFLCRCNSVTTLDLKPLGNVTTIGWGFLWGCSSLTSIELMHLKRLVQVESYLFLGDCSEIPDNVIKDFLRLVAFRATQLQGGR